MYHPAKNLLNAATQKIEVEKILKMNETTVMKAAMNEKYRNPFLIQPHRDNANQVLPAGDASARL